MNDPTLAHFYEKRVKEETLVPICIERSVEMECWHSCHFKSWWALTFQSIRNIQANEHYAEDTNSSIVLSSKQSRSKLSANQDFAVIELDNEYLVSTRAKRKSGIAINANQLAYIIYTSGSTGKPKGVMIEHSNAYSFICWCQQEFSGSQFEVVYAGTSICFDLSIFEIFYPLSIGKRIRILENGMEIEQYLPGDKNVLTNSVPTVVQSLLKEGTDLSNISVMIMAGEPIHTSCKSPLMQIKSQIRIYQVPRKIPRIVTAYRLKNGAPVFNW